MYQLGKWGPKLRCDLDRNSGSLSPFLRHLPYDDWWWWDTIFILYTWTLNLFLHPLITVSQGKWAGSSLGQGINSDQKFCLRGQSSVLCSWGQTWMESHQFVSLSHLPVSGTLVSFSLGPLELRYCCACPGWRQGQAGARSQGQQVWLCSQAFCVLLTPSSGPCGVQVSFLEAFHSCSYLGSFSEPRKLGSSTPLGYLCSPRWPLYRWKSCWGWGKPRKPNTDLKLQQYQWCNPFCIPCRNWPLWFLFFISKMEIYLLSHWDVGRQNKHACNLQSHCHQCVILENQYFIIL